MQLPVGSTRWLRVFLPVVGACLAVSGDAAAQSALHRFSLRGEFGLGTNLAASQRSYYGDELALQASGRLGFALIDPLSLQLSASNWRLFSPRGDGQALLLGGGVRFEPRVGTVGRPFLDANAGVGLTGGDARFMLDVGLGFEFAIGRALTLGPALRYGRVFATDLDFPSDAQFWSAGIAATVRVPEPLPPPAPRVAPEPPPPPPPDTDRDGVIDDVDLCLNEPAGEHPDPARRGCPLRDSDSDGVFDNDDVCPGTPQGEQPDPERRGCPDGDDDNDAVLNHADQCRTQHHGMHPDPARPGCPAPDRDNDSVPDATDACPDVPGAPSTNPRRNGCPGLVRIENGQVRILQPVFFATNRDTILRRSFPVLRAVAEALRATPEIRRIGIDGHTDDVGDDARNMDLSQRRADSVSRWLVATGGMEASRLEAHGRGETRPAVPIEGLSSRALRTARASNRRVEFHILDPQPTTTVTTPPADGPAPAAATPAPAAGAPTTRDAPDGARRANPAPSR